jgi:hypothetical protein
MRSTRRSLHATILSLLLTPFAAPHSVRAEDDNADEYDVKARVVRVSLIKGEASLKRNGNSDWERARLNFPLVEGDTVSTDRDSRLEIQIDARNFVRLEANSILRIVTLRDEGVALSVVEGTVSVRLAKLDRDHEYFEVDAPKVTMSAEKKGLYRIDVPREGRVRLTVRDGGRARIYSENSGFALRDGRAAELIVDGSNDGDWELLAAGQNDLWDSWVDDRERHLAQRMRYNTQYYDNYIWGAEDLDAYGNWAYVNDYGWIWRPNVTIINNYNNWAPYRHGYWTWCPPYGWTWVGYEPWGWAPYHYGRWVYYDNYWAWCPHSQYYRNRSWWRPALVAFNFSFGDHISWYPLSYHHRDPRARNYNAQDRLTPLRRDELANLRRVNPAYLRAVTGVSARDFGADGGKFQAVSEVAARRVMSAEPLRGDLPVRPANASADGGARGDRSERVTVARPARVAPTVDLLGRSTGAAARTPGVALDNELRRSRVFNGREPSRQIPMENNAPGVTAPGVTERATETRPTGAVARPARPVRVPVDRGDEINRGRDGSDSPGERSTRPARTYPRDEGPAMPGTTDSAPRERRPTTVPSRPSVPDNETPAVRPDRPERTEQPDRSEPRSDRPTRPPRNDDSVERPMDRPERRERTESPAPSRSEPPTQRSEPAPRYEPPPQRSEPMRNEPSHRSEPSPQRSEPVHNDPAPRSEPPPQRSEPAPQRSEPPPQRSEPAPQRSEPPPQRSEPARPERDRPLRAKTEPRR